MKTNKFKKIICCFFVGLFVLMIPALIAVNLRIPGKSVPSAGNPPSADAFSEKNETGAENGFFGRLFPVGSAAAQPDRRDARRVAVCGSVFALRMYADGVSVSDLDTVETDRGEASPGLDAGFLKGDLILAINGKAVTGTEMISREVAGSGGAAVKFTVRRAGSEIRLTLIPVKEADTGVYKAGLWLRDSTAGIGTMTFYDPDTMAYAALGHCVCDADTGLPIETARGSVFHAQLTGIRKGESGAAGELTGTFSGTDVIGDIQRNTDHGIYGVLREQPEIYGIYEIADEDEIAVGAAEVVTAVDNDGPKAYSVEIKETKTGDKNRNMVIRVTDTRLLAQTGGIVQGMSGSPILQNGKLVGAITHVLLDDSATGYAIYAKTMYGEASSVGGALRDAA